MLQQTQASRVAERFPEFIRTFPTIRSLARASLPDVLTIWQGLGYNRRAKSLHTLARLVVESGGRFPRGEKLEELPGIGPYTAGAISAFAFNEPAVCIETNIRTVLLHEFFPGRAKVDDRELALYLEALLDRRNPRRFYSALMDYGAHLKRSGIRLNEKSRGYVRQAPFKGSRRELRGVLLKLSLVGKLASPAALARMTKRTSSEVRFVLRELRREGLLHA